MATIYLHIGSPKTGSTALQYFLPNNQKILNKKGIIYPDFEFRYKNIGKNRNAHFLLSHYYKNKERVHSLEQADFDLGMKKLSEVAKQYDRIILSDEGLWKDGYDEEGYWEKLKSALDENDFEIKIIVYLRKQASFVQSHYAQKIKEGKKYSFEKYLKSPMFQNYPLDYYKYLSHLEEIFGKENLIVRVFEKGQFLGKEKTIYSDFLEIFGLGMDDGFVVEYEELNTSYEGDYLEMKRIFNSLDELKGTGNLVIREMKKLQDRKLFSYNTKKYTFFKDGQEDVFMDNYNENNSKVAKEYLGRSSGELFYGKTQDCPVYSVSDRHILEDTMLLYSCIVNEQQKQIGELKKEVSLLNEKVKILTGKKSFFERVKRKIKKIMGK